MVGGCRVGSPLDISSSLGVMEVSPSGALDTHITTHKPSYQGIVIPLGTRDSPQPPAVSASTPASTSPSAGGSGSGSGSGGGSEDMQGIYQLNLLYIIEHPNPIASGGAGGKDGKDGGGGAQSVVPTFPGCQDLLYESRLCCQLFTVYDPRGKRMMTGDAFARPGKFSMKTKGKYVIQLQIRYVHIYI